MNHFVVTAWVGACALYVLLLWGVTSGYRHHVRERGELTPGELGVLVIYLLVVIVSIVQEGVVYRAITGP